MPDVIGSAYVTVRAVTTGLSKDISDGIKKGTSDAHVDRAGREAGTDFSKGFGDSTEVETKRTITRSVTSAAGDSGVKKASESLGRSITNYISKGLFKDDKIQGDFKKTFKDIGGSIQGAISFPSGKIDWLLVLGAPMLGGVVQILSASLGTIVSLLGQIVLSAGGAGVALGGVFAALGVGLLPILLAFKSAGAEMDKFKAAASGLLAPFKEIGQATLRTLAPGLLGSLKNLQAFIPLMKVFGAEQGRIVGSIARQATATLTSKKNMDLWGQGLKQVHTVFKNFGSAAVDVADTLPSIFTAAMPIARQFSLSIAGMADRFRAFIDRIGTAGLTAQFQSWYDKAAQVFRILGDVSLGLLRILKIGSETTGQSMFDRFEVFAKRFEDWTSSVRGHRELEQFFRRSKLVMDEVVLIFADLGKALFGPVAGAAAKTSVIGTLETIRTTWIPPLKEIIQQFRESSDFSLRNITQEIGRFLQVLSQNPGLVKNVIAALTTNLSLFTASLKLLNTVLGSGVGQALANFLGPLLPMIAIANKLNLGKLGVDLYNLAKNINQFAATKGGGISGLFQGLSDSVGKAGQSFSTFGGVVQGTAGLVTGYMAGMADDAATMTISIAASLTNIGIALARGDWISAGIAAVSTGVGFVVGHFMKASQEAKKRAAELKKQYIDIGNSLSSSFKSAFQEVGTTALSSRTTVGLKAIQQELDKSSKGATTFADKFGVSLVEVSHWMDQPVAKFKAWTKQVVDMRVADVMRGDADAVKAWATEMSSAATAAAHAVSQSQFAAVTAYNRTTQSGQGLHDFIIGLGSDLEHGTITFDQYIKRLKDANVPQSVLTKATKEYKDNLRGGMMDSAAGQWFDQLPGKLRDAGRAYQEQRTVEEAYKRAQLQSAPAQEQVNARFQETRGKIDAVTQAYINLKTETGQTARSWAQSSTTLLGIVQQLAGDATAGIKPLGDGFFDAQQKILLTQQGIEAIGPTISQMASESGGSLDVLQLKVSDLRNQFENGLRQNGIDPTIPSVKALLDELFKIPPDISTKAGLTSTENGKDVTSAQKAADLERLNAALAAGNNKTSNTSSSHSSTENKVPKPLPLISADTGTLNASLAALDGRVAGSVSRHASWENGAPRTLPLISTDAGTLNRSLQTLNGRLAGTANKHTSTENNAKRTMPLISSDSGQLNRSLATLNGRVAATQNRHGSSENGASKSMPLISSDAGTLNRSLATLNGRVAGTASHTNSYENGVQKGLETIGGDLFGLRGHIDSLNGTNATATVTLNLVDNMTGKLNMSLNAALSRVGGLSYGGIVDSPTLAVVGEQGRREVVVPVTRPARAMELMRATGLDQLVLSSQGDGTALSTRGSVSQSAARDVTGLKIENAVFNDPVDADIVAAKVRAAIERIGAKS